VYAGTFVFGSLLFSLLWRYATWGQRLTGDSFDQASIRRITQSYNPGTLLYLIDFGLAFVNVWASLGLFIVIALFYAIAPLVHWNTEWFSRSRSQAQGE
ncbi:MAG TPA: hypothetical protein VKU87_03865, partial [Thermomicrobiaceae bacterium]|nr:hypothetical protein [Thermomicrobiaceae bacterium]